MKKTDGRMKFMKILKTQIVKSKVLRVLFFEANRFVYNIRYSRSRKNSKKLVHLIHIGKTGGTAIKSVLKKYNSTKEFDVFTHGHEFVFKDVLPDEYVFFIVRDPIDRFISGFYSRKRQGQPRTFVPHSLGEEKAFGVFKTPNEIGLALSSEDGVLRTQAQDAMKEIGHVNTSFWDWFDNREYLNKRFSSILFVGRQENLNSDFKKLKKILGFPDYLELPDDDAKAHRDPFKSDKKLDPIAYRNLEKWYERDYEFLSILERHGKI